MPARRRRFAIDTPLLPVFNYATSAADIVTIQRMISSMEEAYRIIGAGQSVTLLRRQDPSPQPLTYRARSWGLKMTAEFSHNGKGLPNPHRGGKW